MAEGIRNKHIICIMFYMYNKHCWNEERMGHSNLSMQCGVRQNISDESSKHFHMKNVPDLNLNRNCNIHIKSTNAKSRYIHIPMY